MYDLRDPTYCPPGVDRRWFPRRDCGMSDLDKRETGASAVVRMMVDLAPKAIAAGYAGVPRAWLSSKAQHRAPFRGLEKSETVGFVMDAMVASGFLLENRVKLPIGRPARHMTFPDGTIATPVAGDGNPYPFLATEQYGTFEVEPALRMHQVKVLCMARGLQLDRSYLCHQYPSTGVIEVWRER